MALASTTSLPSIALAVEEIVGATTTGGSAMEVVSFTAEPMFTTTQAATLASAGSTPFNVQHRPVFGGELSGVAKLTINGSVLCSGALIGDSYVLTAAHCVTNASGASVFSSGTAAFAVTAGANPYTGSFASVAISSVLVHPGWTGSSIDGGNDLAILQLASAAPAGAARYQIYTGTDEVGQASVKSGWGATGTGTSGSNGASEWRMGQNRWDATFQQLDGVKSASVLVYDFDDGTSSHDALGTFGFTNTGLGDLEIMGAPGDSGGPSFIGGKVAGISSFRLTYGLGLGDIDAALNSSYGEIGGDTRVSFYASWIASAVPELPTPLMFGLGLALLALRRLPRRGDAAGA